MTRLGWAILLLIALLGAGFASLLSFGTVTVTQAPVAQASAGSVAPPSERAAIAKLVVPVHGIPRAALTDGWGDPRGGGARGHEGIDVAAPRGTPVLAAAAGRVEKLFRSVPGGITLYQRSADGRWIFYYAHLQGYAPGMAEGRVLRAGEALGYVGDSGNAVAGDTHLHFGVQRMRDGAGWWQGEAVNPYPLLAGRKATR